MATTPLRGFDLPEPLLIPTNENNLLNAIRYITSDRQYLNISKSILSIQHKLNIAMYQGALVHKLDPDHYTLFALFRNPDTRDVKFTNATYKISSYSMNNLEEYLLALSFFIETFAATIFSLFDVSGSLINQLYMLNIREDDVSFHKTLVQIQRQGRVAPDDSVFRLLCSYSLAPREVGFESTIPLYNISWMRSMKEIRNRTTHRPITDVCDFVRRGDIYSLEIPHTEFLLNENISSNKKLRDFVKEVFDGVEEFVEDFYFYLSEAVQRSSSLPIY